VLAIAFKPFEYAQHLLGWLTVSAVRHQFGVTQDGVERCPQFMAHIGEELRLVLARLLKLPTLVLDFIEQTNVLDSDACLIREGLRQFDLPIGNACTVSRISTIAPTGLPSRSIGTARTVRNPNFFCTS
jgi:hypothetical protein